MANEDSFINEVAEEVRRERLYGYVRRYGWIAITAVVLLVGGAAFNEYRKAQAEAEAQARGDAILTALSLDDADARATALASLTAEGDTGAVLSLLAAAESSDGADRDAALARLEALASSSDLGPAYRDLAALKFVMLSGEDMPAAERIDRLAPLTPAGAPYRPLALEQTALAHVANGNTEGALEILEALRNDGEASQGLRRRASQLIVVLGGAPSSL